jgi:hypothetical protein
MDGAQMMCKFFFRNIAVFELPNRVYLEGVLLTCFDGFIQEQNPRGED